MRFTFLYVLILWSAAATSTAYYVSPNGNDLNRGTRWVQPFRTLQKAANSVQPGDTVYIMKGDYYSDNESLLQIQTSGNENGWIVFVPYLNHKPILHAAKKYGIHIRSARFISIEGLTIMPGVQQQSSLDSLKNLATGIFIEGNYQNPCTHIKLFNNFIQRLPGPGIDARHFDYLTISYNKFYQNSTASGSQGAISFSHALDIDNLDVYHNFIQGNVFEKNGNSKAKNNTECQAAIQIRYESDPVKNGNGRTLIHNNILYTNNGGGMHIENAMAYDVINNTLYKNSEGTHCAGSEIEIINSANIRIFNNIFYSTASKRGSAIHNSTNVEFRNNLYYNFSSKETGVDDVIANPEFEMIQEKENKFNFRLKGNSPAINAGIDQLLSDIDFEGNTRKLDTHVDLGALEFSNRLMPSLKNSTDGIQTRGLRTQWSSLYTKDQKIYTIWNQLKKGFSIRLFDMHGNLIYEKIRNENSEPSFEIDFNPYIPGFYSIFAFTANSNFSERIRVQDKSK